MPLLYPLVTVTQIIRFFYSGWFLSCVIQIDFNWSHSMSRSPFLPPAPLLWKTSVLGFHSMSLPQPLQWGLLRCHTPSPVISCSGCPIFCSALLALPVPAVPQMRETLAVTLNFVTGLSAVSTARIFFFLFFPLEPACSLGATQVYFGWNSWDVKSVLFSWWLPCKAFARSEWVLPCLFFVHIQPGVVHH